MENLDLAVVNGTVVTPSGVEQLDIAVRDGRIVALGERGAFAGARETIDVAGKVVLPGFVDTHTHIREPGYTHKEDFTTATQAAAAGGVTLCVGMPNITPSPNSGQRYRELTELMAPKICVDTAHWAGPPIDLTEMPDLIEAGAPGVKVFQIKDTKRGYPHIPELGISDDGHLLEIFRACAATGMQLLVHPHHQELMDHIERKYFWAENKMGPLDYARAPRMFDYMVVNSASHDLILMQQATGAKLHILHVNSKPVIEWIAEAKAKGQPVTGEVNPRSIRLTWDDHVKWGPYVLGRWTPEDEHPHIWAGINEGALDVFGSDHAPHTREEKEVGWTDMWACNGGAPEIEHCYPMLLDKVNSGKLTLERLVKVCCENPARLLGAYPRKGAIRVGADADFAVCDMNLRQTITEDRIYSKCGWSSYTGNTYTGFPVMTVVRGRVAMRDGEVIAKPGDGKVILRDYANA